MRIQPFLRIELTIATENLKGMKRCSGSSHQESCNRYVSSSKRSTIFFVCAFLLGTSHTMWKNRFHGLDHARLLRLQGHMYHPSRPVQLPQPTPAHLLRENRLWFTAWVRHQRVSITAPRTTIKYNTTLLRRVHIWSIRHPVMSTMALRTMQRLNTISNTLRWKFGLRILV